MGIKKEPFGNSERLKIKKAGALCSGFISEISVFNYGDYFRKVTCNTATAIVNALCYGYIRIVKVINNPQAGHFTLDGLDAGSAADQIDNLVCIQLPAHKLFKRYDFAASLIRSPALQHAGLQSSRGWLLR